MTGYIRRLLKVVDSCKCGKKDKTKGEGMLPLKPSTWHTRQNANSKKGYILTNFGI